MNQHELGDGRTIGLEKTGVSVNHNGDMKIFTVPTWLAQDTDLISTVLLDLRCQANKEGDYRNKHLSKEINDCEVQLL